MSTPESTQVGLDMYAAVEPLAWADAENGYALLIYLSAIGLILDDEAALVRTDEDGNDGWSAFADPHRCPENYLFTLAQWSGIRYPRRVKPHELRDMIGPHAPSLWRGTRDALIAAVQRYLSGPGTLYFEERADGDPYKLRIFTYGFDTLDEQAIRQELLNDVPAGLIVDYQVRVGQTYQMLRDRVADYAAVKATYATYGDVLAAPPP